MKRRLLVPTVLLFFGIMMGTSLQTKACEIEFEIVKGAKEHYVVGDVIEVTVTVTLTHRNCPVAIEDTEFKSVGMKISKATKWKQVSPMVYERKLLVVIEEKSDDKDRLISATRTCKKDGGFGSLILKEE